jgi:hypothetical protein
LAQQVSNLLPPRQETKYKSWHAGPVHLTCFELVHYGHA